MNFRTSTFDQLFFYKKKKKDQTKLYNLRVSDDYSD